MTNKEQNSVLVISHANCLDGMAAAAVACGYYQKMETCNIKLHYMEYHHELPYHKIGEAGHTLFVDYCPTIDELREISVLNCPVEICDHHPRALEIQDLLDTRLPAEESIELLRDANISDKYCGAILAYMHLYGTRSIEDVPLILQIIDDRDRWQWKLPQTDFICTALYAMSDNKRWDTINWLLEKPDDTECWQKLTTEGQALVRNREKTIEAMHSQAHIQLINGFQVLCANTNVFPSEVCHALLDWNPTYHYAATYYTYYDDKDKCLHVKYSVRTRKDGPSVHDIVKPYSGGGHHNAGGMTVSVEMATGFVVEGESYNG